MTVYLLHIDPPYKHAKHYVGWTRHKLLKRRINKHLQGNGSPLIRAAIAAGCRVGMVYHWPDADRHFEKRLKMRKDVPSWCPLCALRLRGIPKWTDGSSGRSTAGLR